MFGDIVKVTPTSKVVGDMAIYMVTNELTPAKKCWTRSARSPSRSRWWSSSTATSGQPHGGFPEALQKKILKGQGAAYGAPRPGARAD